MNNCKCGKPAHPLYHGKCEDCWADDELQLLGPYERGRHTPPPSRNSGFVQTDSGSSVDTGGQRRGSAGKRRLLKEDLPE